MPMDGQSNTCHHHRTHERRYGGEPPRARGKERRTFQTIKVLQRQTIHSQETQTSVLHTSRPITFWLILRCIHKEIVVLRPTPPCFQQGPLRRVRSHPAVHRQIITTIPSMLAHSLYASIILFHASIIGLFLLIIKKNALFLKKLSHFLAYVKNLLYLCRSKWEKCFRSLYRTR